MKKVKKKSNIIVLNKFLALNAEISRREADKEIKSGRVRVNEKIIKTPHTRVNIDTDKVLIKDKTVIAIKNPRKYYLLNKPSQTVSSTKSDSSGLPPITSFVKSKSRLFPVGRLDIDSEGLIILTNDGDVAYKLSHPKHQIEKEYLVVIEGSISENKLSSLEKGVLLSGKLTKPCRIDVLRQTKSGGTLKFILKEGKHRQVRRMCSSVDLHVIGLRRVRIGSIKIGNLKTGKYRKLSDEEIKTLSI
ncbi:pseudouridine synthase [Patescibacteria group bacterium]